MEEYTADFFVLRTPLMPFSELQLFLEGTRSSGQPLTYLEKYLSDPLFMEAIFIASPDLYDQITRYKEGLLQKAAALRKLEASLFEYFIRAAFRCTPFGLFAGCTMGTFGEKSAMQFNREEPLKRHVRLDMNLAAALGEALMRHPEIYKQLLFFPNNSIYRIGNAYRYTEYRFANDHTRTHHLVKIDRNTVLDAILKFSNEGAAYPAILTLIISMGYSTEEAEGYIQELTASQLLVPEIAPNVTGMDYLKRLLSILNGKQNTSLPEMQELNEIQVLLDAIEQYPDKISFYNALVAKLSAGKVSINKKKAYQVDLFRKMDTCQLDTAMRNEIQEGIKVLRMLNPEADDTKHILRFRNAFSERYEDAVVPLAEVMDSETGITYKKAKSMEDHYRKEGGVMFTELVNYKFRLYNNWLQHKTGPVVITDEDLKKYGQPNSRMADSYSVMAEIMQQGETHRIILRDAGGSSGANLLGRFAYHAEALQQAVTQLCEQEEANEPEKMFAEIVHLPQARIGNILARPTLRRYEIPYLANSILPQDQQIPVSDLYLCVRNNRLVLFSAKHKKEIVPRLSTAHNFRTGLPIYNFLCDLQLQDVQSAAYWSWSFLIGEPHLPRVMYKNTVLCPARWLLNSQQVAGIAGMEDDQQIMAAMKELREAHQIPGYVILCQSDNRLLLDLDHLYTVKYLLKAVKKSGTVHLEESSWSFQEGLIKDGSQVYTNEVIIPFVRKPDQPSRNGIQHFDMPVKRLQRKFPPGSEWVYFKLYTSDQTSDQTLANIIFPLLHKMKKNGLVKQWFFVRYTDPKHHIRIRIQVKDPAVFGEVVQQMYEATKTLTRTNVIWNLQLDTYVREIERYGQQTMELSEEVFCSNSEFVSALFKILHHDNGTSGLMYATFFGIEALLSGFGYTRDEKLHFYKEGERYFTARMNNAAKKMNSSNASDYYRQHNNVIYQLYTGQKNEGSDAEFMVAMQKVQKCCRAYRDKTAALQASFKTDKEQRDRLMYSYVHMFVNRMFARYHPDREYQVFAFLSKFLTSAGIREKNTVA